MNTETLGSAAHAGDGPVFVVGMNGSGTTMLADSLGNHPDLYVFPFESKVLPYFMAGLTGFGDLEQMQNRRRLADEIGRAKPYWQANGKRAFVLSDRELESCSTFGCVVAAIYANLAARQGKPRWGEKSPANTQHIAELARHFPTSRFIHIIRDGRDAAQSFHRRWGFHPRHTIWRWKRTVLDGRAQGAGLGPGRYLELRYEAVTADPAAHMELVCRFAGLTFDPAVLQSSMRYMDPANREANSGRIIANSEKWREYFKPRELAALEALAGRTLRDLGYPVETAGDADLGLREQRILRFRDGVARTRSFFREYGIKALPMYLRALEAARKQRMASRY